VLFISLHRVVVRIADSNAGDYKSSASELLSLIENESDFPTWYRHKSRRPKRKGEVDMTAGPVRGKRLLEHAELSGEPVEYDPTFAYGHDFYEMPSPPDPIYAFIRGDDTILGFQIAEIEPFLARHGLRGFGAIDTAVASSELTRHGLNGVDTHDGSEVAARTKPGGNPRWWETAHDIEVMRQLSGERLNAAAKRTSNTAIAKDIATTINAIEKSKDRTRTIGWDTVRGALTGWRFVAGR